MDKVLQIVKVVWSNQFVRHIKKEDLKCKQKERMNLQ